MMKRFALLAICAMAVLAGCQQKGKSEGQTSGTVATDSLGEVTDTVPKPIFLIKRMSFFEMNYWTDVEEPSKEQLDEEYYKECYASWSQQEAFRRRARQYTHLISGDSDVPIAFFDEVLKDPDGNTPSIGQLHGREEIPSLCARYKLVNPSDENDEASCIVAVTDSYLQTRRRLTVKIGPINDESLLPLPDSIVTRLEQRYGMKASRSYWMNTIGDRYIQGCLQFEGEYKDAPKTESYKRSLALEVIVDGSEIYACEVLGYYESETSFGWNVDDEGEYIPNCIECAFEGPNGLELCYTRSAVESFTVGMAYVRDGKYVLDQFDMYQYMIDEEIPVWKADFAKMKELYREAAAKEDKDVELTKWAHCYLDYSNEWIWLRDSLDQRGAFFIRKDGQFRLIAVETPQLKPTTMDHGHNVCYLCLSSPEDGMTVRTRVIGLKDGEQIEEFTALKVNGIYTECQMNGKSISPAEGKAYIDKLPEREDITAYFSNIEGGDYF